MKTLTTILLLALAGCAAAADAPADRVLGRWLVQAKDAQVQIQRDGDRYFGAIVWLKEPQYPADDAQHMGGQTKVDRENPEPALRARPILGLRIVAGFRYDDGEWTDGKIYDPKNGKTYKCYMRFDGEVLRVRGYIGFALLGRTERWTRVP